MDFVPNLLALSFKIKAMKKVILSAAFILALNGFAAAQTNSRTQEVSKTTQKTAVKKGTTQKTTTKKPTTKNTETSETVAIVPKKLNIIIPAVDTTCIPVKN